MKKKIVSVSLALVFVMAVLAGCAGKSGESGSGPGSGSEAGLTENGDSVSEDGLGHIGNGEDITLKMLATQEDQEVLKEMADAFARKYSEDVNLTVELEACPQKDINNDKPGACCRSLYVSKRRPPFFGRIGCVTGSFFKYG